MTFLSSDDTHFRVHRKNLEANSEGLSPPDGTTSGADEVIPLSETAEVLELLFQYMYPQRQPDLTEVPFDVISAMAEAAEKYQVFSAMGHGSTMMQFVISINPDMLIIELISLAPPTQTTRSRFCCTQRSMAILS